MDPVQRALTASAVLLLLATLAGLLARRRARVSYAWTAYMACVATGELLLVCWPRVFWNWSFFVAKETLYSALKLALALEMAALVFSRFPGARATVRRALLLGLAAVLWALLEGGPIERPGLSGIALALQPRLANGTAVTLMIVWGLIFWYHVPVHRLHRVVLRGLVPYLLLFTVALQLLARHGWDLRRQLSYADAAAYLTMLLYWTVEAWRPEPAGGTPPAVAPLLGWRARL